MSLLPSLGAATSKHAGRSRLEVADKGNLASCLAPFLQQDPNPGLTVSKTIAAGEIRQCHRPRGHDDHAHRIFESLSNSPFFVN